MWHTHHDGDTLHLKSNRVNGAISTCSEIRVLVAGQRWSWHLPTASLTSSV